MRFYPQNPAPRPRGSIVIDDENHDSQPELDNGNGSGNRAKSENRQEEVGWHVVPAAPIDRPYTWLPPHDPTLALEAGSSPLGYVVEVPLGGRRVFGVVWEGNRATQPSANNQGGPQRDGEPKLAQNIKLLRIFRIVSGFPRFSESFRRFAERMASYVMSDLGSVVELGLPGKTLLREHLSAAQREVVWFRLLEAGKTCIDAAQSVSVDGRWSPQAGRRPSAARLKVLEFLARPKAYLGEGLQAGELCRQAGVSRSVLQGLVKAGLVEGYTPDSKALAQATSGSGGSHASHGQELSGLTANKTKRGLISGLLLNTEQEAAVAALVSAIEQGGFATFLLDGMTGSGKTEVYLRAIERCLALGRDALVLTPEITLTAQWLERVSARGGAFSEPVLWHSRLSVREKREMIKRLNRKTPKLVVGARSALHLPIEPGLIVVDEEHDPAYKQQNGVRYHARDMAILRAQVAAVPVVLVSATPPLESIRNAELGRYRWLRLQQRTGMAGDVSVRLVDLRKEKPARDRFLSGPLLEAMATTLQRGEQSLLFVNRRGYAPLTLCRACGYRARCRQCDAWLVEHRRAQTLVCHHCDARIPIFTACPACHDPSGLSVCGPGAERIFEEVRNHFPKARVALATSDTLLNSDKLTTFFSMMESGAIDLVVGTQIIAKGHHFPKLTLVGVVDADMGLEGGDFRANERTFQMIEQVMGRAGREDLPGAALVQTVAPERPVFQALAARNRERFFEIELEERRAGLWPPFGRLVLITISSAHEDRAEEASRVLMRLEPKVYGISVLGPTRPILALLRGRHRWHILVRAARNQRLQPIVAAWLQRAKREGNLPPAVSLRVDVDPLLIL